MIDCYKRPMKIRKQILSGGIFAAGEFVLRDITSQCWTGKCSAWYWPDGTLHDAEWIRRDGQRRNVPRYKAMWREMERLGKVWK
jgi:hypothetical protein